MTSTSVSVVVMELPALIKHECQIHSHLEIAGRATAYYTLVGSLLPPPIRPHKLVEIATFADNSSSGYVSKAENIDNALVILSLHT